MTELELTELEALADAATPGPWEADNLGYEYRIASLADGEATGAFYAQADAAFVVAARTAVPELIAEVRRLRDLLVRCLPYMRHTPLCNNCIYGIECDCGHDAILEELDGWVKAAKVGGE